MTKEATVTLLEQMQFGVRTGSGAELVIDAHPEVGGQGAGPRPMELQLAALAGCTAMDVISILRKMRQDITSYQVSAQGETATEHPQVYTSILLLHRVAGTGVLEVNVRRAIQLSMERYCPVFAMLSPVVAIRERFEIVDEAGAVVASGEVEVGEGTLTPA